MQAGFRLAPRYTINGEPKRVKGWQNKATTELEQLKLLIAEAEQTIQHFRSRQIATDDDRIVDFIVVPPKKFCIIDIDNKGGKNGSVNWNQLQTTLLDEKIEPTVCVKTKSGGFHYYFRADIDYVKSVANFAGYIGVDIRGQRGHVILPYRIGEIESWREGEYLLYKGDPRKELPLLKVSKISKSYTETEEQLWLQEVKESVSRLEPVDHIPEGARDNVLWDAACILYRKGVKRGAAENYMLSLADVCQISEDLSVEQIRKLALDKVERVYKHDRKIVTVIDFERELALGGLTRIANDGPSKYFFEHDNLFKLDKKAVYSKEALADTFKGIRILVDDGEKQKIRSGDELFKRYVPDQTVYSMGFYPDSTVKIFRDEASAQTMYNVYEPTFTLERAQELVQGAEDMYPVFVEFLQYLHPTKWEELLNRIAWTIQFPQLKMVTLGVYVSSIQGVGKDILCDMHGIMLGPRHYKVLNSVEELTRQFLDLSDTLLVNIAEAQMGRGLAARNRMTEFRGLIKHLTTSSTLKSERKNVQASWRSSFTNFVMTTNEFNPNMLEHGDRRHEVFIFPSNSKLDQSKFGRLADLSKLKNFPSGQYPYDKLATIWWGLKQHKIDKRYHIESANLDTDKEKIYSEAISPLQAWLLTELPDIFSQDFVTWFISNFYPQKDRIKPIEETQYFFTECRHLIQSVKNNKGSTSQRLSLTKLHRLTLGDGKQCQLQRRCVPKGPNYYQYLHTIRNHGDYDDRATEAYYLLEEEIIKHYNEMMAPVSNKTPSDIDKLLQKFRMKVIA